ncbi:MAG: hypothetical protein WCI27_02475 [Candidatus Omnitrophota bacterium]
MIGGGGRDGIAFDTDENAGSIYYIAAELARQDMPSGKKLSVWHLRSQNIYKIVIMRIL